MAKILSLDEFASVWQKSHPHDVVKRNKIEGVSFWGLLGVLLVLIAVNILSASHTIPVIVETTSAQHDFLKTIIAVSGFIAIEFAMVLFMVNGKTGWIRNLVIFGALAAAVVANLKSTLENLSAGQDAFGLVFVGVVLGLFAPLANLGIGEVFRKMQDEAREKRELANKDYDTRQKHRDGKIRIEYTKYLIRVGITDPSQQLQYMSGNITNDLMLGSSTGTTFGGQLIEDVKSSPTVKRLPAVNKKRPNRNKNTGRGKISPQELAHRLVADGDENLTYDEIQMRYHVSPNKVRAAKALIESGL